MSMAVDYRPQPPVGGLGYDHSRYSQPQFTNPWQATAGSPPNPLYQSHYQSSPSAMEPSAVSKAPPPVSMGYVGNPAASTLGSGKLFRHTYTIVSS